MVLPPKQSAEFVFHMEDVLEVYHRPYDPKRPVLCIDETFKQLIGETRTPLPLRPGMVAARQSGWESYCLIRGCSRAEDDCLIRMFPVPHPGAPVAA